MNDSAIAARRLTAANVDDWIAMRRQLFPSASEAEHQAEAADWLARADRAAFGARVDDGWLGFIEVGSRDVGEGCETSPVGYIEALWVDAPARRQGIAHELVEAAIAWCRERSYRELGSDVEIENSLSQSVHEHLGFEETERFVTYRIDLRGRR